jgi:hypothetical protein
MKTYLMWDRCPAWTRLLVWVVGTFLGVCGGPVAALSIAGEGVQSNFSLALAIYYSFVTLTTLGYGDIVPRSKGHAAWPLWKPLRANSIAL